MDAKQKSYEETEHFKQRDRELKDYITSLPTREQAKSLIESMTIPAVNDQKQITIEITDDPNDARILVQELVAKLRGSDKRGKSREVSLAITKLQEAAYWLGESIFSS